VGHESSQRQIDELNLRITRIEKVLYGLDGENVGLLEKHRALKKQWTIIVSVCIFVFSALGRIISPLYDKFVSDWVYNSPSQRWEREQKRPRVKVFKIVKPKDANVPAEQQVR